MFRTALILGATVLSCSLALAQGSGQALSTLPTAEQVINRNSDPYAGSIPQGTATAQPIELTVEDALDRGLKYNLGLYLSERVTEQERAAHLRALAELLPNINAVVTEQVERINLKSFGFKFAGFPSSVGPFGNFILGASGSWTLLSFSAIDNIKAANQNVKASQFSYKDARDTVVLAVGANYLLTIANESRVESAKAQLETAQALYQLATDQEAAGLAPNIDTLRARVQLQAQQELLITAQNDLEKQRIALARVIGLPATQKFRLVNRVPYHPLPEMNVETAYQQALQTRPDYQAAQALLKSAQLEREAAWKEYLPSVGISGNYSVLGYTPSGLAPNYSAGASLNIPVFTGGRTRADVQQTEAVLKQRQAQVDDLKGRIEQDVQNALLDLNAAAQQVEVARTGLDLAQQTVAQSQDRFAAGVTNNVEVIQAQQQLAFANDQYITSLYAHNIAKVLLARAIGNAEQAVKQYLSEPGSTAPPNGATPPNGTAPPDTTTPTPATTPPSSSSVADPRLNDTSARVAAARHNVMAVPENTNPGTQNSSPTDTVSSNTDLFRGPAQYPNNNH